MGNKLKLLVFVLFVFGMFAIVFYLLVPLVNNNDSQNNHVVVEVNKEQDSNSSSNSTNSMQVELNNSRLVEKEDGFQKEDSKKNEVRKNQLSIKNDDQPKEVAVKKIKPNIETEVELKHKDSKANSCIDTKTSSLNGVSTSSAIIDKIHVSFQFSEHRKFPSSLVSIDIPVRTHEGQFESYTYSAVLENNQFNITWNTPGWFHLEKSLIKEIQFTGNSVKVVDLNCLKQLTSISLVKLIPIELILETFDGSPISDGTYIMLHNADSFVFNLTPLVLNQKGTIFLLPNEVIEIYPIQIGDYFSDKLIIDTNVTTTIPRKLILKRKIKFSATFQDAKGNPYQNHYVYFSNKKDPINQYSIITNYRNNGIVDTAKFNFIYQTNQMGEIDAAVPATGEYTAVIFGKNISKGIESKVKISVDGERLQVKINISTAVVKINFFDNGVPYLKEVNGSYHTYSNWENFSSKDGFVVLKELQEGYFQLELKNEGFINDRLILTIPLEGSIEKNVELKRGAFLSGTLTANGEPIKNEKIRLYLYVKGDGSKEIKTDTDLNGHFRFENLDPNITYVFFIDVRNYAADPSVSKEYRSSENEITINLIKRHELLGEVYGKDGKPATEVKISSFVSIGDKIFNSGYLKTDENKFNMTVQPGNSVFLVIKSKGYATHYQEFIFDPITHASPLRINLQNGFLVNGKVLDKENKPIQSGYLVELYYFERYIMFSNRMPSVHEGLQTLGASGSFTIENAVIGEKYLILSEGNLPIPFTIEDKSRFESVDLKVLPSFQINGTLKNNQNQPVKRIPVEAQKLNSKELAGIISDDNGAFIIQCLTPGKWKLIFHIRDKENIRPSIEVEIIDKDVTINQVINLKN